MAWNYCYLKPFVSILDVVFCSDYRHLSTDNYSHVSNALSHCQYFMLTAMFQSWGPHLSRTAWCFPNKVSYCVFLEVCSSQPSVSCWCYSVTLNQTAPVLTDICQGESQYGYCQYCCLQITWSKHPLPCDKVFVSLSLLVHWSPHLYGYCAPELWLLISQSAHED